MNEEAKKRALRLLEKRDYSRKMLMDKLTGKGVAEEDAAEVADWLCEIGVVDDGRFAELVVRHYAAKGYGRRRVSEELYRRGISQELREEALAGMPENDDSLLRLLTGKLRGTDGTPEDIRKAQDFLLRRGYSWGEIRAAVEHYQAQNEDTV